MEKALFGAGCFWGVEDFFLQVPGVTEAVSGYAGGTAANPSYKQVCQGDTNHAEVVEVTFDPAKVSYAALVDLFFKMHNPTQLNRQGPDFGTQYRSVIFTHGEEQTRIAGWKLAGKERFRAFKVQYVESKNLQLPSQRVTHRRVIIYHNYCGRRFIPQLTYQLRVTNGGEPSASLNIVHRGAPAPPLYQGTISLE